MTRGWKPRHMFALFVVMALVIGIGTNPTRRYEMQIGGGYGDTGIDFEADGDVFSDGDGTFGGGDAYVGVDDTTTGAVYVYGDSGSGGAGIRIYNSAGEDTTVEYHLIDTQTTNIRFGNNTSTPAVTIDTNNGNIVADGDGAFNGGDVTSTAPLVFTPTSSSHFIGATTIGDDTTPTNGTAFAADGLQTMEGTGRAAIDIEFDAGALGLGPANNPELKTIGNSIVYQFDDTADEELWVVLETPHDWDVGTDFRVRFHWAPLDGNAGNVTWGVEYVVLTPENNEVLTAGTTTGIVNDATQSLQDELLTTGNVVIAGAGIADDDMINMRFFRDADASEGGALDDYGVDIYLIDVDVEYMRGRLGKDEQW